MLPTSGARVNTRAPPFEKKGGGRVPAPLLGVPAQRSSSKRSTQKKKDWIPHPLEHSSRHNWGVPAPRTNNMCGPRKKKPLFLGVFLRPRRPAPRMAPHQRPFWKKLAQFSPPPPPRQHHPTVWKYLKRPPVRESGVFLWVGPFCWEGCAYMGPWLRIKVSFGWIEPSGIRIFCHRETGNAGWGWGKCGGS